MVQQAKKPTFVIHVLDTQNMTWQGTVTWLDGKHQQPFRSLLELVKLMDSVIVGDAQIASESDYPDAAAQ